jgi:predicted transcriptional regulator
VAVFLELLDKLIILLNDGKWHNANEIAPKIGASENKVQAAVNLLAQYELIQYDKDNRMIRTCPSTKRWLEALS